MYQLQYKGQLVSVNEWLEPAKRGVKLTERYAKFLEDLQIVFQSQWAWATITHHVTAIVSVKCPEQMDVSNITKPLFDAMEHAEIVENDRLITDYRVIREPVPANTGEGEINVMFWILK